MKQTKTMTNSSPIHGTK